MTTTELYSGYTAEGKPSSRITQPPGGGSSNIFGGPDPTPQQEVRREQQQSNQNANDQYPPQQQQRSAPRQNATFDAQQEYQRNKPKGRAEAPFASFDQSGKSSKPTQFNRCDEESQKDADFRCYSVTAYRDAVEQNAAIRQRARGQAAGSVNPITHQEHGEATPYQQYEQPRVHPQSVAQEQPKRMVRGGGQPTAPKVQYNPITGEEYPADYQQHNKEETPEEQTPTEDSTNENNSAETTPTTEAKPVPEAMNGPPKVKTPSVKVRQPPGGKSSGPLW